MKEDQEKQETENLWFLIWIIAIIGFSASFYKIFRILGWF